MVDLVIVVKRNPKICLNCAGKHNTINCTTPGEHNCANFMYSNHEFKTNYNTKHVVNDTEKCEVMIHKIKKLIVETDYPVRLHIPKFVGKVNFPSQLQNTDAVAGIGITGKLPTTTTPRRQSRFTFRPVTSTDNLLVATSPLNLNKAMIPCNRVNSVSEYRAEILLVYSLDYQMNSRSSYHKYNARGVLALCQLPPVKNPIDRYSSSSVRRPSTKTFVEAIIRKALKRRPTL